MKPRKPQTLLTPVLKRLELDLSRFLQQFFTWEMRGGVLLPLDLALARRELLETAAALIAERMVTGVLAANAKTWRAAASESLRGKPIYQALKSELQSPVGVRAKQIIQTNRRLIASLPDKLYGQAQAYIVREQLKGRRAAAISSELRALLPERAQAQIRMLARTEVGRAETGITQARAERIGLSWYEWQTSEDQRVRASHRKMDGVLVNWNDPPCPEQLAGEKSYFGHYHPGVSYNCRCVALPLVSLDEVAWPHRCYTGGRIVRVSRTQFEKWMRA